MFVVDSSQMTWTTTIWGCKANPYPQWYVTRAQGFYLMTPKIQLLENVSIILQQPIMWVEMDIELQQL